MKEKWYEAIQLGVDGCDATLNVIEFGGAVLLGIAICAAPFVVKAVLLAAGL